MKLLKLSMRGFKSFADRTDLHFDNGTTVIVGPNGSGKSNISDALRWVLGETSARNLRGSKMEDVIYVGSDTRRGLGFAEVEMVLDNSDKTLPIDFSEVSISRRLYKSGESEYSINRTVCRAKDIKELFMDTGVGRDGYSIIGQGRIDAILSDRPEDRRSIFEEVAGIVKYKNQKEDAERKLEKTNQNLLRIEDLLTELNHTYEEICVQAEKTKKYHVLYEELKKLDIAHAKYELVRHLRLKDENIKNNHEIELGLQQNEKERQAIQRDFETMKEQVTFAQKNLDQKDSRLRESLTIASELKSQRELSQSRLFFLDKDLRRLEGELTDLARKLQEENEHVLMLETNYQEAQEILNHSQRDDSENEKFLNVLKTKIIGLKKRIEERKEENSNLLLNKEGLSQKYRYLQKEHSMMLSAAALGKESNRESESKKVYLESEIQLAEGRLQELEKRLAETNRIHMMNKEKILSLQSEYKELEKEIHHLDLSIGKKESEKKTLSALEESFEGYQKPVREIMHQFLHRKEGEGILGTISDLFQVSSRYLQAIEVSLGSALQYVVIEKESEVQPLINYLKEKKSGRVTFLPLDTVRKTNVKRMDVQGIQGIINYADQLLNCEEKYRSLFQNLLSNTLIVESMGVALTMDKQIRSANKIVTLDGELFHNKGSITGGFLGTKLSGILQRKNRITELEEQIENENQKKSDLSTIKDLRMKSISELEKVYDELQKDILDIESLKNNVVLKYRDLKKERDELLKNLEGTQRIREEEEKKYQENVLLMKKMEREMEALENRLKENNSDLQDCSTDLFETEQSYNQKLKAYNENHLSIVNLKNRVVNIDEKRINSYALIDEWNQKVSFKEREHRENKKEYLELTTNLFSIEREIESNTKKTDEYATEKSTQKDRLDKLMKKYYSSQDELNALHLNQTNLERRRTGIEIKIAKLEVQVENILSRVLSDYQIALNSDLLQEEEILPVKSSERISELKSEISELGSVNTNAVEEERKLGERLEFLLTQEEDLHLAKADLETVIKTIEEKMGILFQETMVTVQDNFSKVYTQFFGGGNVELKLSNPEDPLNSGIEILLTPPGKKMQAISLLSGGERALTAIALLFAIQKIKPSPFCILDEIDAALDEVNIDRFTGYLKSSLDDVQFILITHRKKTMEIGDSLYGISMGEDGVSSILSVRLKDKMMS